MATTLTGLRVQDTYNAIIKIGDNSTLTGTGKLLSDGFGNSSNLYLSTTSLGIGVAPTENLHIAGSMRLTGSFKDKNNESGTTGQVLTSTATGTDWKTISDIDGVTSATGGTANYVPIFTSARNIENSIIQASATLVTISGNLDVNGTVTYIDTIDLSVKDPLIKLANANVSNTLDIGFYGKYVVSATTKYLGLYSDASDSNKFRLFTGLETEPTTVVDSSDTTFAVGTLIANIEGGTISGTTGTFSNTLTANGGINGLTLLNGGITGTNYNIAGVNQLTIADPGEGIVFTGTTTLTLAVIDDTVDDKLKLTNATQLDLDSTAKITNLVDPTNDQDAATKKYVDDNTISTPALSAVLAVGNTSGTNNLIIQDDDELILGSSNDFRAYHNQTNTLFRIGTGDLIFNSFVVDGDIKFQLDNGSGSLTEYMRLDGGATRVIFGKSIQVTDNVNIFLGNSTTNTDGYLKWDSTASQIFIGGESKFLNNVIVNSFIQINPLIGTNAFNGNAVLRINATSSSGTASQAYIQTRTSTTGFAGLLFGDTDDNYTGGMIYNHSDDSLGITTNNILALTLNNDQSANFIGNQTIGNTLIEADRILKIQTFAEYNSEVQLRESTDNYGFTMRYNGTANKFKIIRHDNSAAGVDVITIGRGANTVEFAGGLNLNGTLDLANANITNVNNITIADAGVNEGINWAGGNLWKIYESPNDLSNAAGNLQFVKDTTRSMTLDTSGNLYVLGALTSTGHINNGDSAINGSLTVTSDTGIKIRTTTNGVGAKINFSDQLPTDTQQGTLYFAHADNASIGSGAAFHFDTTETQVSVVSGDANSEGNFLSYSRGSTAEVDYGFVADLNTGMYRPANHQLGFVVNGSRKIQLTSTGVFVQNGDLNVVGNIGAEKVTIATPSVADGGTLGANILSLTGTSETTPTSGTATPTNGIVFKPAMPAGYGIDGYNTVLEQQSGGQRIFYFRTSGASNLSIDVEHDGIFGGDGVFGGNLTATGATFAGTIISDSTDSIRKSVNNSNINISGGNATNAGANYALFGGTHATLANVHRWRSGGTEVMNISSSGNMDLNGTILCNNGVIIDGTDAAGNTIGTDDQLRVTGYGLMGNRAGQIYITNGNAAATASIVFGVRGAHNGNNKLKIDENDSIFYTNVTASGHNLLATGGTVKSQHDSTHYAQLESSGAGGVVKGIGGGGFLQRSYGDTYFNGGNFGIGIVTPARGDYGSITPKLHVLGSSGNGEYRLAARFQAGGDADNTGAAVLINMSNDRGLLIEAGRESSDRGIAHFGIVNSSGTNVRILSLKQHSGTDYRFGVNAPSPKVDFDFQKYNSTNGSSSTMRIGGNSGNESSKLELAETVNASGVMTYGYALVNDGSANKFRITSHNNSAGGNNSFEIDRVTGNVGIKGVSGSEALQVNGNIHLTNDAYISFNTTGSSGHPKIYMYPTGNFQFRNTANLTSFQVYNGGNIDLNYGTDQIVLVKGGTMNFGVPGGGANVNSRFCTIEGNTDSSGEGSGRIFFAEHNSTTTLYENYGMSLGYRGGGTTLPSGFSGLTQIGNGEWGMWGHNNSQNGTLIMSGTRSGTILRLQTTHVEMKAVSQRVKFSLWTGTTYGFGMQTGYTFGGLNSNYAITCQMSNTDARGFWWGDNAHSNAQGAFACTTNGKFTIAHSLRLGYGEGDTTIPGATYRLDVSGTIRATADIIAYSDARVKDNVKTIRNALEKVSKLRGVSYTRNDIDDKSTKIGVIAQEIKKVFPEVVSVDNEDRQSVAYGNMAGVFIEAIKELKAEIEELKNKSCNCKCK